MRFLDYLKRFTYTPNEFYDYLKLMEDAASGNVDIQILPAMKGVGGDEPALEPTVTEANAEGGFAVPVEIKAIQKISKDVLEFFNGTREVKVDITTTAGTIAINDGDQGEVNTDATFNLTFVNGVGKFTIVMDGTWAEDETIKVTVDDDNVGIMGYSIEKNNHFLIKVKADPAG